MPRTPHDPQPTTAYAIYAPDGTLRPATIRATEKYCVDDYADMTGLPWLVAKKVGITCRKVSITPLP